MANSPGAAPERVQVLAPEAVWQGLWVRALDPEERCVVSVGVGVHNKNLKSVSLTPPQEAGKPMGAE